MILLFLVSSVVATLLSALDSDPNRAGCDSSFGKSEKCNILIH